MKPDRFRKALIAQQNACFTRAGIGHSINDQIVLLRNPILRETDRWMVPVDFLTQGLSKITGTEFRYRLGAPRIFAGAVAALVGTWEMVRAVGTGRAGADEAQQIRPPLPPLMAGGVAMLGLAWYGGAEALAIGLVLTVLAVLAWRLGDGPAGYRRDVTIATLIAVYVPFLAGFAALLLVPTDGAVRVIVVIAAVVLSDTGGYIAGVLFGRHPMSPTVSPKKSWEGLAGSLVATAGGSAVILHFALKTPWWAGAVFGLALSAAAVLGDLAESLLKRDLGIKDMGRLLPGHGGAMDRLDSLLLAAPVGYVLLSVIASPTA